MDTNRHRAFCITWPSGIFFRFNYATRDMKDFGKMCGLGEAGKGAHYRTICRSIAVDPANGSAWYSTSGRQHFSLSR